MVQVSFIVHCSLSLTQLFVTLTLSSHSRLRFFESFHLSLSLSRRTRDPRRYV
ncbi:hypothetical protein GLYMA_15G222450v4 [Glycine max]|nr:hypothetical protein GLYMA_15G222450v4 [Glycine max]